MTEPERILVVDDEDAVRRVLVDLLSDEGYAVRAARHGVEALAILHEWPPDAILLDMWMPVMDGQRFRVAQRQLPPPLGGVPVVLLSASRELGRQVIELDAAGYVAKPFDLDAVLAAVSAAIAGRTR